MVSGRCAAPSATAARIAAGGLLQTVIEGSTRDASGQAARMTPPEPDSHDGMPTGLGAPNPEDDEHRDQQPVHPPGLEAPHGAAGMETARADALVELNALLGRGTRYAGKLYFEGRMRIEGTFSGEIRGDDVLVIGEGADVEADIEVGVCIVTGGTVRGSLRARDAIELHAPAVVAGDLHAPNVFIDRGAQFEGNCTMAPLEDATSPTATAAAADERVADPLPPSDLEPIEREPREQD